MKKKLKILITGGAGMIGSSLAKKLCESYDVYIVDNFWRGSHSYLKIQNKFFLPKENIIEGDLTDKSFCKSIIKNYDLVYHLADIVAGINYVFDNQYYVWSQNILINTNVISTCIENKISNLIYVGTACSYPKDLQKNIGVKPLVESDAYPALPESSYGWSKLMGEYELLLAILRLHNVYGPPCSYDEEMSQVIPSLCRKAINYPLEDFIVWGSGNQRRAFIYIDDVIDALTSVKDYGINKGVIQIGPNKSSSIKEIAEEIVKISSKNIDIKFDTNKPEGDMDRSADFSKAQKILNWKPKTTLEEGLMLTYKWIKDKLS
jgi:nucleoside-diphosphate-sugar epimerase